MIRHAGWLLLALSAGGCAVGPSYHPEAVVPASTRVGAAQSSDSAKAFFDSLAAARQNDTLATPGAPLKPRELLPDSLASLGWLDIFHDSTMVGLVRTALASESRPPDGGRQDSRVPGRGRDRPGSALSRDLRERQRQHQPGGDRLLPADPIRCVQGHGRSRLGARFLGQDASGDRGRQGRSRIRGGGAARGHPLARERCRGRLPLAPRARSGTDHRGAHARVPPGHARPGTAALQAGTHVRARCTPVRGPSCGARGYTCADRTSAGGAGTPVEPPPRRGTDQRGPRRFAPAGGERALGARFAAGNSARAAARRAAGRAGLRGGDGPDRRGPGVAPADDLGHRLLRIAVADGRRSLQVQFGRSTRRWRASQCRSSRAAASSTRPGWRAPAPTRLARNTSRACSSRSARRATRWWACGPHATRSAAQQTQAQALRRAFQLAELRYRTGIASYIEVLDAQRSLFDAELGLSQAQLRQLSAAVLLYRALGGAWPATSPTR